MDETDTIRVPRGGYASVQIVAKAFDDVHDISVSAKEITNGKGSSLTEATAGWVGYVKIGRTYPNPSSDILRSHSGYFPDPIITDSLLTLEPGETQPFWITIPIPYDAEPGLYSGRFQVCGKVGRRSCTWEKHFFIRIYPVILRESPLYVSNWMAISPVSMSFVNGGNRPERFSQDYWEILDMFAKTMVEHRQNVFRVFPLWTTGFSLSGERYSFDFSRFDQEIGLYEKHGALKLIEGGHLAWRAGAWKSDFMVEVPLIDDEEARKLPSSPCPQNGVDGIRLVLLPVSDPRAINFHRQFLPALKKHLEQNGWLDKYVQHIGDEPTVDNSASYVEICERVHEFMPGVRILDALMTSRDLSDVIDVWVPLLSVLHKDWDFYQDLKSSGKEVWYYVCNSPKGNYANRFIELPLIQTRSDVPTTMGLRAIPQANVGAASGKGFEVEIKFQKNFRPDLWLVVNGDLTYASSRYTKYEEPDYSDAPWLNHVGMKLNQPLGFIAERLFIDEADVNNSPVQSFGMYGAGDIKYKDINRDGIIDSDDRVPIGYPLVPEVIYGAGFSFGWKMLDLSVFFQGSERSSFFISSTDITPFVNNGQRALLKKIAEDHWSENNRDLYAFWPRLSANPISNNNQTSTWWLRNGGFLRLKTAEFGVTVPDRIIKKTGCESLRVYFSGSNLLCWSKFDLWDPEMGNNGLGYPLQRVLSLGVNVNF